MHLRNYHIEPPPAMNVCKLKSTKKKKRVGPRVRQLSFWVQGPWNQLMRPQLARRIYYKRMGLDLPGFWISVSSGADDSFI
jgi:hypothetical protein